MKKKTIIALIILLALSISANATIWICDNTGVSDLYFTTLQAANNSEDVQDGDTIYVNGSADTYGNLNANKQLYWIGTGYFLGENPMTQARAASSRGTIISFQSGSEGSVMMGFILTQVAVAADDIMIARNYFFNVEYPINLNHNAAVSNTIITQNYIRCNHWHSDYCAVYVGANHSQITLTNNIIYSPSGAGGLYAVNGAGPMTIAHNVFNIASPANFYALITYNSTIHSNIINGRITANSCIYYNNLTSGTELGDEDDNVPDIDMAEVFLPAEGNSSDGRWQLAEESPAIGAGYSDTDCGCFDGLEPYVLSGIPPIPTFSRMLAPNAASGGQGLLLRTTIKSRN